MSIMETSKTPSAEALDNLDREREAIKAELAFASPEQINKDRLRDSAGLRSEEHRAMSILSKRGGTLIGTEAGNDIIERAKNTVYSITKVEHAKIAENFPHIQDDLQDMLDFYSLERMSRNEWRLNQKDAEGNEIPNSSGRAYAAEDYEILIDNLLVARLENLATATTPPVPGADDPTLGPIHGPELPPDPADLGPVHGPDIPPLPPEFSPENLKKYEQYIEEARNRYAEITAGRRRVTIGSRKYSLDEEFKAKNDHQKAVNEAGMVAARMLELAGATPDEIRVLATCGLILEANKLTRRQMQDERIKTGRYEIQTDADGSTFIVEKTPKTIVGRQLNKFYDWWAKNSSEKFFSKAGLKGNAKRGGAMFAIGLAPGIALGMLAGPLVGGVLGGVVAKKLASKLAASHVEKKATGARRAEQEATAQYTATKDEINGRAATDHAVLGAGIIGNIVEKRTEKAVTRNRKRMGASILTAALAGAAGAGITDHFFGAAGSGSSKTSELLDNPKPDTASASTVPKASLAPRVSIDTTGYTGQAPWAQMNNILGTRNATPKIMELAEKAKASGWKVDAHTRGISSMTSPDGQVFSGNARVTAALDYLNKH